MAMETTSTSIGKMTAKRRTTNGKEAAAKLRAAGLIPAVCYGKAVPTIPITVDPVALKKALDPARRHNTVITLTVEADGQPSETFNVMLKDHQEDTLKRVLLHADFVRVADDQVVAVTIPLILEGKSEGVKLGGTLHQVFRELPVRCIPSRIPTLVTVDISALQIGDSVQVKDLKGVTEGVTVALPQNQTIALCMAPRKVVEETAAAPAEGAEGAAPAEGAEGAEGEGKGKKEDAE